MISLQLIITVTFVSPKKERKKKERKKEKNNLGRYKPRHLNKLKGGKTDRE